MLFKLAWRNIWRNRRRTLITVISIALGLCFAIFFVSLGDGIYAQLIDQVTRMQSGYVTLEHPEYLDAPAVDLTVKISPDLRGEIEKLPGVENTKLIILGQGIVKSSAGSAPGAIMGVEPDVELDASPLARNITAGSYLENDDGPLAVIGSAMADRLNLEIGKKLVLSSNDIHGDLVESLFRVKGIYSTGSDEMDAFFLQIPLVQARDLFRMPKEAVTRMGLILNDPDLQPRVMRLAEKRLSQAPVAVRSWQEVMPDVASYIKMDKGSNFVFQGILLFLILFTIFNTILMSVLERRREFAMLLALGTEPRRLQGQVLIESFFLALIGCAAGSILGALATYWGQVKGIDLSMFMGESVSVSGFAISSKMHPALSAERTLVLSGLVFAATMIISLLPMRRSTRVDVVEALR